MWFWFTNRDGRSLDPWQEAAISLQAALGWEYGGHAMPPAAAQTAEHGRRCCWSANRAGPRRQITFSRSMRGWDFKPVSQVMGFAWIRARVPRVDRPSMATSFVLAGQRLRGWPGRPRPRRQKLSIALRTSKAPGHARKAGTHPPLRDACGSIRGPRGVRQNPPRPTTRTTKRNVAGRLACDDCRAGTAARAAASVGPESTRWGLIMMLAFRPTAPAGGIMEGGRGAGVGVLALQARGNSKDQAPHIWKRPRSTALRPGEPGGARDPALRRQLASFPRWPNDIPVEEPSMLRHIGLRSPGRVRAEHYVGIGLELRLREKCRAGKPAAPLVAATIGGRALLRATSRSRTTHWRSYRWRAACHHRGAGAGGADEGPGEILGHSSAAKKLSWRVGPRRTLGLLNQEDRRPSPAPSQDGRFPPQRPNRQRREGFADDARDGRRAAGAARSWMAGVIAIAVKAMKQHTGDRPRGSEARPRGARGGRVVAGMKAGDGSPPHQRDSGGVVAPLPDVRTTQRP